MTIVARPEKTQTTIKVAIDAIRWHIRPNHTDWQCLFLFRRFEFSALGIEITYPCSVRRTVEVNLRYLWKYFNRRVFSGALDWKGLNPYGCNVSVDSLESGTPDVIYCHSEYPLRSKSPVFWRNTILDPEMQAARGATKVEIAREREYKIRLFRKASAIQVASKVELNRLSREIPEIQSKLRYAPYFLPSLDLIPPGVLSEKCNQGVTTIAFVGRHARRKGLDLLLAALELGKFHKREDVKIVIVSRQDDGKIHIPSWKNLSYYPGLPTRDAQLIIKSAHVFAMPSRFESYGLVYVEAMAQGTIPLVPSWEVQRELVDEGRAGLVVSLDPRDIARALSSITDSHENRKRLAFSCRLRAELNYTPEIVAPLYANAFRFAAGLR